MFRGTIGVWWRQAKRNDKLTKEGRADEIGEETITYINENLLREGFTANLVGIDEKEGMYEVSVDVIEDGQEEGEQSESGEGEEEQEQQGQPQPGEEDPNQEGQPSQVPAPGQRMTEEQAKQLLAAIAENSETLQERLGQIFSVPWRDPVQDW